MRERMRFPWSRPVPEDSELRELEEELDRTRLRMAQAYAGFNAVSDQEMVESYIYEIQALRVRYSCLLRRRKALEPREGGEALPPGAPALALPVA